MAYARYDKNGGWYIFWYRTKEDELQEERVGKKPKAEETLAVWHNEHRADGPLFTYAEVSKMACSGDYSRIPGYSEADRDLLVECFAEFLRDVDEEYGTA